MKRILLGLSIIGLLALPLAGAVFYPNSDVQAQATKDAVCQGISATGGNCNAAPAERSVNDLVAAVINIFSWIVGVVAVIFVIFGGFKYITSAGDSNKVSSAKSTIIYALVGLVIVALAQIIVVFVLNQAT
jgi:heme/copper-type cytochrome/quinol oxidase subunit 2